MSNTSMGMDERLQAMLGYLVPVVLPIIWLVKEQQNRFVRFHAAQSLVVTGAFIVIRIALGIILWVLGWIPVLGGLVSGLLTALVTLAMLAIWILLMVRSMQGENFRLPVISDLCDQFVG